MTEIEETIARLVAAGWSADQAREIALALSEQFQTRDSKEVRVVRAEEVR